MKKSIKAICFLLTGFSTTFAQQTTTNDSLYTIQDSILIPTKSGIDISAILVRKKSNTQPLPVVLFYTTYYQGVNDNVFGKRSADRDYVGIVAYARGIRTDINNYKPYENEATDITTLMIG